MPWDTCLYVEAERFMYGECHIEFQMISGLFDQQQFAHVEGWLPLKYLSFRKRNVYFTGAI